MSLAVASLLASGDSTLQRSDAAAVSYPSFWDDLTGSAADADGLRATLADGSFSLESERFGEAFHSSAGALNEARARCKTH